MISETSFFERMPRIGLGCMGMSEFYGACDDNQSLAALHRAYDIGYRHFDTADMYGSGHNERLLGRFLADIGSRREGVLIASKTGITRDPMNKFRLVLNGRPEYIRDACEASLRRLGIEQIDLYYLHRQDPNVPLAESVGALGDLVRQGKIAAVGLCEVSASTLETANTEYPISAVQSEYSLWSREIEQDVGNACGRLGIPLVAFSPLGRGILSGTLSKQFISSLDPAEDLRANLPRFQDEHLDANLLLVERLRSIAEQLELECAQVALAWIFSKGGQHIRAIPSSTSSRHLICNFAAGTLMLPEWALVEIEAVFAPSAISGARYPVSLRS